MKKKYWYTAVWGKRDSPIITVEAANVTDARVKALSELLKNPSRATYLPNWLKSKKKMVRKKPWLPV